MLYPILYHYVIMCTGYSVYVYVGYIIVPSKTTRHKMNKRPIPIHQIDMHVTEEW